MSRTPSHRVPPGLPVIPSWILYIPSLLTTFLRNVPPPSPSSNAIHTFQKFTSLTLAHTYPLSLSPLLLPKTKEAPLTVHPFTPLYLNSHAYTMCNVTKNYYIYEQCQDPGLHFVRTSMDGAGSPPCPAGPHERYIVQPGACPLCHS